MEFLKNLLAFILGMFSTKTLKLTKPPMSGPEVVKFETLITASGCSPGEFSGVYDEKCVAACKAFQQKRGLTVDGVCGASTWAQLNQVFNKPQTTTHAPAHYASQTVLSHAAAYVQQPGDPVSAHFKLGEFHCHDGNCVPKEYFSNVQNVMKLLERIRSECGDCVIHINSGYRSPSYNGSVGGVTHSQHMLANAADIWLNDMTPDQVYAIADRINPNGGVGRYNTFTHVDCRCGRARWDGRTKGTENESDEP